MTSSLFRSNWSRPTNLHIQLVLAQERHEVWMDGRKWMSRRAGSRQKRTAGSPKGFLAGELLTAREMDWAEHEMARVLRFLCWQPVVQEGPPGQFGVAPDPFTK